MNIVSMALQYLTPAVIDRIATSLGIQSPLVKSAIIAILPSILAGLAGVVSKPGGGRQLGEVLNRQNTDILGDLGSIFGGPKQAEAQKAGSKDLSDLLGGSGISGLTIAVSKFAGVGDGAAQSLLGLMAPVALGTLATQQKASGLDAAGLTNLLVSQKDNISAAMPKGFADLLGGTGLLAGLAPAPATFDPPPASRHTSTMTESQHKQASGLGKWPMVAAAAALAVLGYYYYAQQRPAVLTIPAAPQITLGSQNVGAELGSIAEGLRGTLVSLKDEATARTALPRLQQMAQQLGGINEAAAKLPPDGRRSLASYAAQLVPLLRPMIEQALKSAGVGPIAKPVLDQILNRLESLGKV